MRNLKKVLSLVLCVAMMLSVMVMGAGAAFTDQDKIVNEEAVDMISALGIVDGYEDDSFQPEKNIERGEAAKMIAVMLNGGKDAVQDTSVSSFNDVLGSADAWANKYIEYGVSKGILAGVGGDRFAPASNVTGTQLAKMLLVSLGYDADKEGYLDDTSWAVNVNTDAASVGLYAGIESVDMNAALTRDNAAQMIWNALNANTVRYSILGGLTENRTTLLQDAFGANYTLDTGVMAQVYYNKDKAEYTYSVVDVNVDRNDWEWSDVIGGGRFIEGADTYTSTTDYSDLFAMSVKVLHNGKNALCIRIDKGGTVVEGVWGDVEFNNNNNNTFTVNGQKYRLDNVVGDMDSVAIPYNGFDDNNNVNVRDQYAFRAIDLDGGNDVDLIVFYPYVVLNVDDVDTNDFTTSIITDGDAKLFVDPGQQRLRWLAGTDIEFDDVKVVGNLERYGYAMAIPATYTAQGEDTYVALDIQTATPSALSENDELITLNGTQYTGELLTDNSRTASTNIDVFEDISLAKSYNYVEVNGYLFILDGAGVQAPTNYTVVTDVAANTTGTTAKVYSTDLLLSNGETVTVDAKVTLDSATPAITATTPVVGVMYTYDIDNAGNYILTRVKSSASYADNDSIYDVQQAYKTGARLAAEGIYNVGDATIYDSDAAGGYFLNNSDKTTKYYVEDDAAIFVYYTKDDTYDVITGEELMDNDDSVAWAFTGASEKSNGFTTVDLGYVALGHDIDEVTYDAYVLSAPTRVMTDDNGDFYVTIEVLLSDGSTKTLESKHVDLYEDAKLLQDLYAANPDDIYELTVLDGVIVHEKVLVDMKDVTVDATYDKDGSKFMATNGVTYVIDEDTLVYSLDGNPLTAITKGDTVWVPTAAANASAGDVVTLTHLVYDD